MTPNGQLFTDGELFTGNPLEPDFKQVCPETVLAALTFEQRTVRLQRLIEQAHYIIDRAWEIYADGKTRAAWAVLYSGGNDSTVLMHLVKDRVDCAIHANTTIGIEETRQFVRDTCAERDLDLIERVAPVSYRDLVLGRWKGFPGPGFHHTAYQRLKERPLDEARAELVTHSRRQRVLFIAGRRRAESQRRQGIPFYEPDGSAIWASPLAMWAKSDLVAYRAMHGDVPFNPVTDHLGMSGECLCGAFAQPGELERIRLWYPDQAEEIDQLQRDAEAASIPEPFCRWGHGQGRPSAAVGRLCTSCDFRQQTLFDTQEAS